MALSGSAIRLLHGVCLGVIDHEVKAQRAEAEAARTSIAGHRLAERNHDAARAARRIATQATNVPQILYVVTNMAGRRGVSEDDIRRAVHEVGGRFADRADRKIVRETATSRTWLYCAEYADALVARLTGESERRVRNVREAAAIESVAMGLRAPPGWLGAWPGAWLLNGNEDYMDEKIYLRHSSELNAKIKLYRDHVAKTLPESVREKYGMTDAARDLVELGFQASGLPAPPPRRRTGK